MSRIKLIKAPFITATGWTVLGNETTNLATVARCLNRQGGTALALEFDKADASETTKAAGASMAFAPVDLFNNFQMSERIGMTFYVSAITNVDYAFLRLGASASHMLEWRLEDDQTTGGGPMIAGWNSISVPIGRAYVTGNGNPLEVDPAYMAVGVMFDGESNTLADIAIDSFFLEHAEVMT